MNPGMNRRSRRRVLRVFLIVDVVCAVLCLAVLAIQGPSLVPVTGLLGAVGSALLAASGARRGGRS